MAIKTPVAIMLIVLDLCKSLTKSSWDKQSGNWWLRFQDTDVGYWPGSIFTRLSDRADAINWGGEIVNRGTGGRHTSLKWGVAIFQMVIYMGKQLISEILPTLMSLEL
ncbi:hypothetical protein COLO4_30568 [Corchorus olitorius]|uniref:Neprosin PEP catalytic domain-containing protein n=1 Tax=Corchorus olitorius TaxID=93759 RepID=A0A1R3H7V6_9ROSI|nr:hypothetical protein COLO4_30568 [Corchorus olitorius]